MATSRLQDLSSPQSPWLEFSQAWILQRPNAGAETLVSLDDAAVSLVADAANPGARFLAYPTKLGVQKEELLRSTHPQDPSRLGFYILPMDNGHGVLLGSISTRINLNHAVALEVGFQPDDAEFWFRLTRGPLSETTFFARSTAPGGVFVVAGVSTAGGLVMAANPGASAWRKLRLGIDELISEGPNLKVQQKAFSQTDVWLAQAPTSSSVSNATGILSPSSRLGLELELPFSGDLQVRLPVTRIAYRDSSIASGHQTPARDRHYGVRVVGLGSRTGGLASLDADVAIFELTGSPASPQFHLKAGAAVPNGSAVLVPKADFRIDGKERRLEIPVGDLALEVISPSIPVGSVMSLDTETAEFTLVDPQMVAAPIGITSKANESGFAKQEAYRRWFLRLDDGNQNLVLRLLKTVWMRQRRGHQDSRQRIHSPVTR